MIRIIKKPLTRGEAFLLIKDNQRYPDLIYVSEKRFRDLPCSYIAEIDGQFAGLCGVYEFASWIKIGPLVALQKYHGKGLGRTLIETVLKDFPVRNIHISSSNEKVQTVVVSLGFSERKSFFMLPGVVQRFLLGQLMAMLSLKLIAEGIRKSIKYKRRPLKWYVRYNDSES
ncbi:GNAT family N-acetyltransferase [Candidatus Woesebacteria bacterium]|nr:GNAT family N-acetyltransferase [Candidatus Woesebacteria bacterium]